MIPDFFANSNIHMDNVKKKEKKKRRSVQFCRCFVRYFYPNRALIFPYFSK